MAKFIKLHEVELDCSDWYCVCNKQIINVECIKNIKCVLDDNIVNDLTKNSDIDPTSLSARVTAITFKDGSELYVGESVDWIYEQLSKD